MTIDDLDNNTHVDLLLVSSVMPPSIYISIEEILFRILVLKVGVVDSLTSLLVRGDLFTCDIFMYTYTLDEDTQPVIRAIAIGVSHTACKDEFRQNIRCHSWIVF